MSVKSQVRNKVVPERAGKHFTQSKRCLKKTREASLLQEGSAAPRTTKIALFLKNAIDHLHCGWSLTFEQRGGLSGRRVVVVLVVGGGRGAKNRGRVRCLHADIFLKGWWVVGGQFGGCWGGS